VLPKHVGFCIRVAFPVSANGNADNEEALCHDSDFHCKWNKWYRVPRYRKGLLFISVRFGVWWTGSA